MFIWSCFNSHNLIVRNISMAAKISSISDFGDNYRHLSYKYGIGIHVWHLPLCKLYKCFDLFLLNHHKSIANGVFIRDLCLLRENNIVDDDQDLTSTELIYIIEFLFILQYHCYVVLLLPFAMCKQTYTFSSILVLYTYLFM